MRYYRIKQVDEYGDYSYSSVFKITGQGKNQEKPIVYPNPLTKQNTLQVQLPAHFDQGRTNIMLIDPLGEVIQESSGTSFQNHLGQKTLKPVLYLIQIQNGCEIVVEKLWVR
ncbi:hypothetical protein MM239_09970 [Belliella sp. DSM 111904]|uniref:Secretion system C-terminal sorting domain-containing protein n=1 Tax=Belliella filtrata TaxID=2923435 RepID=A0ABS9UZY3_9BACT|nr:T9SS type A sorting domain-containing protein [Belliella filtrata]MCH7409721.1 hypothetical protein [Belliella filtrata]